MLCITLDADNRGSQRRVEVVATHSLETAESRERVRILDLQVDRAGSDEIQGIFKGFIEDGRAHHVVTANLQFLSTARRSFAFAEVVNRAALVVADGMPLVWMSRMQGAPIRSRITGHDLLRQGAALAALFPTTWSRRIFSF